MSILDVNVAMAVAIDGGLITPTIIKANEKDLFSISRDWKELVDKAKNKKLTPAEYNSGAITSIHPFTSFKGAHMKSNHLLMLFDTFVKQELLRYRTWECSE